MTIIPISTSIHRDHLSGKKSYRYLSTNKQVLKDYMLLSMLWETIVFLVESIKYALGDY